MKRALVYILAALLSGGTLEALRGPENNRMYNRDKQEFRGAEQTKWVRAVGADSDGPISSYISVVVDYEYFSERPFVKKGYDYSAYANVWGATA